jgi:hypothetical protein
MPNKPETEPTPPAVPSDARTWETPTLRQVGHLGDVLQTTSKAGLSEHDPGIETYKPKGQDH